MKTKIFKIGFPVAAVVLAIAGAFASQAAPKSTVATKTGYLDTPSPCLEARECSDVNNGIVCTYMWQGSNHQAFGKNPTGGQCSVTLYKKP
ncbi:hypothetical protein D3C84_727570 [compost metagenome]